MEERIELKDPDHPEAKAAAEATARLLIDVHRKRQQVVKTDGSAHVDAVETLSNH